jgi:REP element-mobilizing transposase RayT
MSRLRRIAEYERFFFITTNVSQNVPFLRPPELDLVLDILDSVRHDLGFPLLGYVIMPDHCRPFLKIGYGPAPRSI